MEVTVTVMMTDKLLVMVFPDFTLGWTNTITVGNWDISMFWNGEFGHDLINTFRGFYENTRANYCW